MRRFLWAGVVGAGLAAPAAWAAVAALPVQDAAEAPCAPAAGRDASATGACAEGDVVQLAARLLVVKFGAGAIDFAAERARRYGSEQDPGSAGLWRQIGEAAAELLNSR